jgi:hypothetical protein
MKRAVLLLLAVVALTVVPAAWASYSYAGPKTWLPSWDASSTYSTSWTDNWFQKTEPGHISTATFIDGSGNWHGSVQNSFQVTAASTQPTTYNKKAYCRNSSAGDTYIGECIVFD